MPAHFTTTHGPVAEPADEAIDIHLRLPRKSLTHILHERGFLSPGADNDHAITAAVLAMLAQAYRDGVKAKPATDEAAP